MGKAGKQMDAGSAAASAARRLAGSTPSGRRRGLLGTVAFIVIALLLAGAAALVAGCGEEKKADLSVDTGGRMQLAETYYDFGPVPVGQQVKHDFVIKNTGTGPLDLGQMSVKRLQGC